MATADKDCSDGSCSIHCPQWCYILFPPPPPLSSSSSSFSPLVIAIIGILASVIFLLSYYTFVSKCCTSVSFNSHPFIQEDSGEASPSNGIDEVLMNKIAVCRYRRGEGLVEGTECSVCLGEFKEEESLRLLPKCSHAFHLQCIDTWLKSHSSCPLCRANILQESSKAAAFSAEQEQEMVIIIEDEGEFDDNAVEIVEEDVEPNSSHRCRV